MVTEVEYNKWVNKVIDFIKDVGPKINLPVSSMQSRMQFNQEIDVVFLGHDAHETAKKDWIFELDEKYIRDRFEFGNHYGDHPWSGRATDSTWKIWNNLYEGFRKIGDTSLLDNEKRFIFTNAVFFTGDKVKEVNYKSGNAVKACMELTSELIFEILKPKVLVCFSNKDVFGPLNNICEGHFEIKLKNFRPNGIRHNLILAEYKGVRIASVPHISGAYGVLGSTQEIARFIKNCVTMPSIDDIVKIYASNPSSTTNKTISKDNDAKEKRRLNAALVFDSLSKNCNFTESPQGSGYKLQSKGLRNKTYGYEVYTNDVLPEAIQIFTEDEKLKKILVNNKFRELDPNKYVLSSAELEKIGAKDFAEKIIPDIDNSLAN